MIVGQHPSILRSPTPRAAAARPPQPTRSGSRVGLATALLGFLLLGCSTGPSSPKGITDPALEAVTATVPNWFPAFPPPRGGVIVGIIEEPSTDNEEIEYGRSVTWRVDRDYDDVLADLDAQLAGLGWVPTDRLATEEGGDSQRTSVYIENGTVEVIRVYRDANLKGVRVTVELPA